MAATWESSRKGDEQLLSLEYEERVSLTIHRMLCEKPRCPSSRVTVTGVQIRKKGRWMRRSAQGILVASGERRSGVGRPAQLYRRAKGARAAAL